MYGQCDIQVGYNLKRMAVPHAFQQTFSFCTARNSDIQIKHQVRNQECVNDSSITAFLEKYRCKSVIHLACQQQQFPGVGFHLPQGSRGLWEDSPGVVQDHTQESLGPDQGKYDGADPESIIGENTGTWHSVATNLFNHPFSASDSVVGTIRAQGRGAVAEHFLPGSCWPAS